MTLRLLVLAALIGITVALTDWLRNLQEELQRAPAASVPHAPDYSFHEVLLTEMDVEGAPRYRIQAPRMAHFAADDSAELLSPHVWFYRVHAPPMELRSQRARVEASGQR